MKFTKKAIVSVITAATMSAAAMAPVANAEVSASVGVASTYLWRGMDLGSVTPAVSGSLDYTAGLFYTGVWASSGDTLNGTEYDLYAGLGGEAGSFTYDVSLWTYSYPTGGAHEDLGTPGKLAEAVVSLGFGPVSATYIQNVVTPGDGDGDYSYLSIGAEFGKFSVTAGQHFEGAGDYTHVDLGYAYNDNLAFTVVLPVAGDEYDADDGAGLLAQTDRQDPTFVVSYSLPIE